jgi:hypothetical protein
MCVAPFLAAPRAPAGSRQDASLAKGCFISANTSRLKKDARILGFVGALFQAGR